MVLVFLFRYLFVINIIEFLFVLGVILWSIVMLVNKIKFFVLL